MAFSANVLLSCLLLLLFIHSSSAQLSTTFHSQSCPTLFSIIRREVEKAIAKENRKAAFLLRLHFHDCFVNGCDGSILLDDTATFQGEKTAAPNLNSAKGFSVVDHVKSAVEEACPGVVSCADILTVIARDSVNILGGPTWELKLGRRDARTASKNAANTNIPGPAFNLTALISSFKAKGLSARDMVALSGSHTIGKARCILFKDHIYNDTNIDRSFARKKQAKCPRTLGPRDNSSTPLDFTSPRKFDNHYYKILIEKKGLLHSDQEFFNKGSVDFLVRNYSESQNSFFNDFAAAMIKMGEISPLTGSQGEIRKNCRKLN